MNTPDALLVALGDADIVRTGDIFIVPLTKRANSGVCQFSSKGTSKCRFRGAGGDSVYPVWRGPPTAGRMLARPCS